MSSDDAPKDLEDLDWSRALAYLPWLGEETGFGRLIPAVEHPEGGFTMPYEALSEKSEELVATLYEDGIVGPGIDWSRWLDGDGERLLHDEDGSQIGAATLEDARRLLVAYVRGGRFNEGMLLSAFKRGHVRLLLDRVAELTA